MTPTIKAIATRLPGQRYGQQEILERLNALGLALGPRTSRVFANAGIAHRHLVVDAAYYEAPRSTEARNNCYFSEALPLGEAVIRHCLEQAGCNPEDIDDFIVVSCTGIDTPGLDLRLAGRLGMRPDLRRTTVLGMGCYAAFPGLLRAREAAASAPGRRALVLALELCSLHLQLDDSLENIVSAALFADGAAAVVIENDASGGPHLLDAETYCDYTTFDHMAFHLTDNGFQMRLSAYVPDLLAAQVESFIDRLLTRHHLRREDVAHWGIHPGSGKILDHVQQRLGLSVAQLEPARAILRSYGNMSSPTVLFVLEQIQRESRPAPGDYGVLMAFGPGLTMESALLRW